MITNMKQKLKELEEDEEINDIIERPVKRVKVDELAEIPHRRPGDFASTFRVPDVDSDGEMEVDEEDIVYKKNVFEQANVVDDNLDSIFSKAAMDETQRKMREANEYQAEKERAAAQQKAQQQKPISQVQDVWSFPSVGTRPADQWDNAIDPLLGKKFELGVEGWKRGMNLVDW